MSATQGNRIYDEGIALNPNMEGAVCFLAALEILDEIIDGKTSSKLDQSDIQAHTQFRVQLAQAREKVLAPSIESGLHAITALLSSLNSTLYEEAAKHNRLWKQISTARSDAERDISDFFAGDNDETRKLSEWLWRTQHPFCNMTKASKHRLHQQANDVIHDSELANDNISPNDYSNWASRLTGILNDHTKILNTLLKKQDVLRNETTDALTAFGSIVFCKGMSPPKSSRNINLNNAPTEALIFTNPPRLNELKLGDDLAYYLNLAEDVASGDVQLGSRHATDLVRIYNGFMKSLANLDTALVDNSQVRECRNTLNWLGEFKVATARDWMKSVVEKGIFKATADKSLHVQKLSKCKSELENDNVFKAEKLLISVTENVPYRFQLDYTSARQSIASRKKRLADAKRIVEKCVSNFREKSKKFFGKKKNKESIIQSLSQAEKTIGDVSFTSGSETGRDLVSYIDQLSEVETWSETQVKWNKYIELESWIIKVQPKKQSPLSALVNIMCALAATDGNFNEEERKLIRGICVKHFKLSETDINTHMISWIKLTRQNGHDKNVAQSIVDAVNIKGSKYEAAVEKCMDAIVRADGKLYEKEKAALKATKDHLR